MDRGYRVSPVNPAMLAVGNTVLDQLAIRKNVRIVDTDRGPIEEVRRVHGNVHIVQADRGERLVH